MPGMLLYVTAILGRLYDRLARCIQHDGRYLSSIEYFDEGKSDSVFIIELWHNPIRDARFSLSRADVGVHSPKELDEFL